MSRSVADVVEDFALNAGTGKEFRRYTGMNVFVAKDAYTGPDTIYSYGYHFPMAMLMPARAGREERGWWLVNSDAYSPTTSGHQSLVRRALGKTGLDMVLLPFSAIRRAGIEKSTITPVEILSDRYQRSERPATAQETQDVYATVVEAGSEEQATRDMHGMNHTLANPDGTHTRVTYTHLMGESVFTARYSAYDREARKDTWGRAQFLSGFDPQEGFGRGYFLCQLPEGTDAETVDQAYAALEPVEVGASRCAGYEVTRQGDIYAIDSPILTRELPGPSRHMAPVLGTNHVATEVRTLNGATFARGMLRHKPPVRQPDHSPRVMGDGKSWHRILKNTVPEGRSWGAEGNVD